jgi:hypothetical protein
MVKGSASVNQSPKLPLPEAQRRACPWIFCRGSRTGVNIGALICTTIARSSRPLNGGHPLEAREPRYGRRTRRHGANYVRAPGHGHETWIVVVAAAVLAENRV